MVIDLYRCFFVCLLLLCCAHIVCLVSLAAKAHNLLTIQTAVNQFTAVNDALFRVSSHKCKTIHGIDGFFYSLYNVSKQSYLIHLFFH